MNERAKKLLEKDKYDFSDLVETMSLLRSEDGCPWDRAQTHESIRNNFLEEAYEAVEAIDAENPEMLREELGDVLLQVVFHAQIEKDEGGFDIDGVCDAIVKKLVFRHPHIFAEDTVGSADEMLDKWEKAKKEEKKYRSVKDTLLSVPVTLPSLMKAEKLCSRTEKGGYSLGSAEEISGRIKNAVNDGIKSEDLGKILFDLCAFAKKSDVDAEEELYKFCQNYVKSFPDK